MNQKKNIIIITVVIIVAIGIAGFLHFHKTLVAKNTITGTVISVVHKPNQAEDGYYSFDVQSSSGQKYTVDATGYLNTPLSPDSNGEACVDVPKVKTGEKVEFNLPKSQNRADTFDICYKKNLTGYYFNLD